MQQVSKGISIVLIASIFVGCSLKDPKMDEIHKEYTYSFSSSHHLPTGENQIFLTEYLNGEKVRLVKKVVIYDKEIPKTITFDSCKSIKHLPVIEHTKNGSKELTELDGKSLYFPSDCQTTIEFERESQGVYLTANIKRIKYLRYMKNNNPKPYVPIVFTLSSVSTSMGYAK